MVGELLYIVKYQKYDGVIVGYIARARRYQVEFTESTYETLCEKIELIKPEDIIKENTVLLKMIGFSQIEVYYLEFTAIGNPSAIIKAVQIVKGIASVPGIDVTSIAIAANM